jgi:hypothetical protein
MNGISLTHLQQNFRLVKDVQGNITSGVRSLTFNQEMRCCMQIYLYSLIISTFSKLPPKVPHYLLCLKILNYTYPVS